MIYCKFCSKKCKNENSLRNHERLCKENPNRQTTPFHNPEFQKNKRNTNQYIKAKELGMPKPECSIETKKKLSKAVLSRTSEFNKEIGKKVSETISKKVKEGTWHTSLARHMHIDYNGIDLHGTWELKYVKYLEEIGISWTRCKIKFPYFYEGKMRYYTPDFYLPDTNEYIEIKGYKTEKDSAKWEQFPKDLTLKVFMKKELIDLGIDIT